ncbi:MAG TPA: RNA polymerase sigma factor [Candidatus Limnocylindrales bacterium]|nr:RNA polymerase sigma factor [Candidatus Limnocylindrales bacterium]
MDYISQTTAAAIAVNLDSREADAFAAWVAPHIRRMALLAERLSGPFDRDDIVQEALIRAWVKRGQFDPERGSAVGWLLAITADRARRAAKRRRYTIYSTTASETSLEDRVDVESALATLSTRQRLCVDCYYFVGLSITETAAVMSCSEGTVKSTLSDARRRLKPILGEMR